MQDGRDSQLDERLPSTEPRPDVPGSTKTIVSLNVVNDDPHFVALYKVASNAIDLLGDTLTEVLRIPQSARREVCAMRWTAYLGTLLEEVATAASELFVLDIPRAAVILNRQVFEYSIRLMYLYCHPDKAEALMDSLQWQVLKEAENAWGSFTPEVRKRYEDNFREWEAEHPELNTQTSEESFTEMAREVLGPTFNKYFFALYSVPSIIAHGKPHGIADVLEVADGRVKRHYNSRTINPLDELSNLAYFLLPATRAIRYKYGLGMEKVQEVSDLQDAAWKARESVERQTQK
jgi:Family of unknown function (DUF5677)